MFLKGFTDHRWFSRRILKKGPHLPPKKPQKNRTTLIEQMYFDASFLQPRAGRIRRHVGSGGGWAPMTGPRIRGK